MSESINTTTGEENNIVEEPYELRISRLTVDKLGVKLYDKVSAVVSELIANSYDADAEKVEVRLPLSTVLASKRSVALEDSGYVIEVKDDGHGMTPAEAREFYLQVGRDRRKSRKQGARSRIKNRPVMGRKGIGKLAPFGICKRIEVLSAGGEETSQGYVISHFFMDYDRIVSDDDKPVVLEKGEQDRQFSQDTFTIIRLSEFQFKRVPDSETFHRQIASRFVFAQPDFKIWIEDTRDPANNPTKLVEPVSVDVVLETKIDLATKPITTESGQTLHATGWLAMARNSYKNEEFAGVRIYARNKIVATTRDFEQPAGFTGEFTIRSYLVGEVHADWLDNDDGEDLIRSDRQGILWESEYGRALKEWGAALIKEIGRKSKSPRRERARDAFLRISNFEQKAKERFTDDEVAKVALDLAKQVGSFAAQDELEDEEYVDDLSEVILSVAPHKALISAFQEFNQAVVGEAVSLDTLLDLFSKTRLAEMASYSQIAAERVKAIKELEKLVYNDSGVPENEFQNLLAKAPWLIEPTWSVISKNQQLRTFKKQFEAFWKKRTNTDISLSIGEEFENKRPDFTLVSVGHMLHIVEIKKANHKFDDKDFSRLIKYVYAFRDFWDKHREITRDFPGAWRIDLIADDINLSEFSNRESFQRLQEKEEIRVTSWADLLTKAENAHRLFLEVNTRVREEEPK